MMMSDFERELQKALVRKQPATDFADRIVQMTQPAARPGRLRSWAVTVAVAASLLVSVGGFRLHRYRQAAEAKQQLLLALEITSRTITKVERIAERKLEE